jgi:diacylglycerol kinase (ATP)
MVHLAVQLVCGTELPLGIVAAGTGNDFARLLGLHGLPPEEAADVVAGWRPRTVDAGRVGDLWFAGVMSSGFDSAVNERANRMRWPTGRMRYNVAIAAELRVFQAQRFRIELDGTVVDRDAMLVAVGNGVSYGGGMKVCPGALVDDGLFAVTVLNRISKPEFLRVFPRVYAGTHVDHPAVEVHEARVVSLQAPAAVAYADGEPIGPLPLTAECVPGALRVLA